jgi:hypothetical protein
MDLGSASGLAQAALRLFLVQHPKRTALGIGLGVVTSTLISGFGSILPLWVNKSAFTELNLAVCGVFCLNVPLLFSKDRLPEHIEEQFVAVRRGVSEGKLSPAQAQMAYAAIVKNVLAETSLNARTKVRVNQYNSLLKS